MTHDSNLDPDIVSDVAETLFNEEIDRRQFTLVAGALEAVGIITDEQFLESIRFLNEINPEAHLSNTGTLLC